MRAVLFLLISLTCIYAGSLKNQEIKVMVNGVQITKAEIERGVKALFPARYYHGTISNEQMAEFEKKVTDELIENELIFQHAKSIGIDVAEKDIDQSIEKLKTLLESEKKYEDALAKAGLTTQSLRYSIYKEEMIKRFHSKMIETTLSEEELKNYYEKNKYKFKEPQKIKTRIIYVKNDPTDPKGKTKAKQKIDEAFKKIKDGEDFADVAAKYSTAMSRIKGGDMGYLHKGMLEPAVEEKAFAMDKGSVSEIIEDDIGYFIVKVEDKSEQNQLTFEAVKKSLSKELKIKIEKEKKAALLKKLTSTAVIVK